MDEFTPGPLLDAVIARLLWRAIVFVDVSNEIAYLIDDNKGLHPLPQFSTNVEAARKLATLMRNLGYTDVVRVDSERGKYLACFVPIESKAEHVFIEGDTKPMAIALAVVSAINLSQSKN